MGMKTHIIMIPHKALILTLFLLASCAPKPQEKAMKLYTDRPPVEERAFVSPAIDSVTEAIAAQITHPKLAEMFRKCFPNTLDTTVHYSEDEDGQPDTYVYTGDIPAMWLRDSGAQVWPYVDYADKDEGLRKMIAGVINRQFKCILIDPYANAFNVEPVGPADKSDRPRPGPYVWERKWEIDSHCYPVRLAYAYWKKTGDTSVFGERWLQVARTILATFKEQQRKEGHGSYTFLRVTDRQLDTKCVGGRGNPVNPVGLIASAFRPSDDATTFEFLIPSNFMAVMTLRKMAEILTTVNDEPELAEECSRLAEEVDRALHQYAITQVECSGPFYAYEVDGFGSCQIMDDANVPSLLSLGYLDPAMLDDPVYRNTRRIVWSKNNPYFWDGKAGQGIGGPHIGTDYVWPMSIMMKAFTAESDGEIRECLCQLIHTDGGTGFMHESFHKDDADNFTRPWFAWANTLFGELIVKLVNDGKLELLNSLPE
ncbi:MAG: glycoside hydrolase family 125 protein [Bacteroidales bacterium]|nr:glycoside hydrolase family 125 protein [Bacteroidales bacterium]